MRRLTREERIALRPIGPPGEHVSAEIFVEFEKLGYGYWMQEGWEVTEKGKLALALDIAADFH